MIRSNSNTFFIWNIIFFCFRLFRFGMSVECVEKCWLIVESTRINSSVSEWQCVKHSDAENPWWYTICNVFNVHNNISASTIEKNYKKKNLLPNFIVFQCRCRWFRRSKITRKILKSKRTEALKHNVAKKPKINWQINGSKAMMHKWDSIVYSVYNSSMFCIHGWWW